MRLSQILPKNSILIRDGEFEIMAQCTTKSRNKIFSFLEDIRFLECINTNGNISCLICKPEHLDLIKNDSIGLICTEQPRLMFFKIHNELVKKKKYKARFETKIGKNCLISSQSNISANNVIIGNDVIIEDNVVIRDNVEIGNHCIIRAGSIIGGQGYEFKRDKDCSILQVVHVGKIIIEDYVEIKELCSIHKAVFDWDYTKIGEHSKIDAHTHIGHATKIGKRVMIGSHSNLAGNINIGNDVYIGPGVTISNRLNVGHKSKISIGSVVTKDVENNSIVTGNFAIDHNIFIKDLKNRLRNNKID